ncbi:MAG: hypothetical protein ACI8QC_002611 [Planctomycetota bacterium]|jgi:hypothetical protein
MIWTPLTLLLLAPGAQDTAAIRDVDYGGQVRPILVDKRFPCHGPDRSTLRAGLRLDCERLPADVGSNGLEPTEPETLIRFQVVPFAPLIE